MTQEQFSRVRAHQVAPKLVVLTFNAEMKIPATGTEYTLGKINGIALPGMHTVEIPCQNSDAHALLTVIADGTLKIASYTSAVSTASWFRTVIPLALN